MSIRHYSGLITDRSAKLPGDYALHGGTAPDQSPPIGPTYTTAVKDSPLTDAEIRKRAEWHPGSVHPAAEIVSAEWTGRILTITVPGVPVAKPRMTRRDRWAKRAAVMRYRAFADRVRAASAAAPAHPEKVLSLVVIAYFAPPKSMEKEQRAGLIDQLHRVKPDASNILKGVEDILWPRGDSAIADSRCVKRWWYEPSLEIRIEI
jgi:Holliday junction resolvase RusA-like endonuclease